MKEKIDIFLCDVRGTYTTIDIENKTKRNEKVKKFVLSLEKIINIDKCNNFIFCFVSTDTNEENSKYITEFKNAINENNSSIIYCDFNDIQIKSEIKLEKILRIIKTNNIRNIYFADDTELYHKALDLIICKLNTDIKGTKFKVNNGLIDLTNKINNYCLLKQENIKEDKNRARSI